jgi:hypothetical protein
MSLFYSFIVKRESIKQNVFTHSPAAAATAAAVVKKKKKKCDKPAKKERTKGKRE